MNETVILWMFGIVFVAIIGAYSFGFIVNSRIDALHETDIERAKTLADEFSERAKTLATELSDFKTRSNQEVRRIEENLCDHKVLAAGKFAVLDHLVKKKRGK